MHDVTPEQITEAIDNARVDDEPTYPNPRNAHCDHLARIMARNKWVLDDAAKASSTNNEIYAAEEELDDVIDVLTGWGVL